MPDLATENNFFQMAQGLVLICLLCFSELSLLANAMSGTVL